VPNIQSIDEADPLSLQEVLGCELETIFEHDNDESGAPLMIPVRWL
jgi:hypothetical protein